MRVDRLSTFIMATALQYSRIDWSAISGTVTDQDGNPLPGAIVEIDGASLYAVSDENGKYTIDTIGPGGYPVSARKPGYKLDDGRADVNLGETTTVNFQLTADAGQPGQMRVLVFSDDEGTKPVKNATVTLSDGPSQVPAAQTDGAGKVEFANLTAGEYSVKVAAQGLTDRTYGGIRVGAGQWTILGAPLTGTIPTEPGSLTGFVQDSEGTGIAGARVEIESGPQDVGRSTLTDANGVYTLDQLPRAPTASPLRPTATTRPPPAPCRSTEAKRPPTPSCYHPLAPATLAPLRARCSMRRANPWRASGSA